MALEDPNDADGDGISDAHMVMDPETGQARLGRFGNKASNSMLAHHIASALNTDMGGPHHCSRIRWTEFRWNTRALG